MYKHFKSTVLIISIFLGCENSYKPNNLIQITTHRIKPSMKKVYEDLIENEFAIANKEYRIEDPNELKFHLIQPYLWTKVYFFHHLDCLLHLCPVFQLDLNTTIQIIPRLNLEV